jgi:fatty acid desaturase
MRSMTVTQQNPRIAWYRSPVDREVLATLNQRSNWKGSLQTLGHLGLLACTGAAAWYATAHLPIVVLLLILYVHDAVWAFLLNAFHELCHKTVFKTKALNTAALYLVSFLSWYNPVLFWASHQEHHKFTLHPPADLEMVVPIRLTLGAFLRNAVVNPWGFYGRLKVNIRHSFGRLEGEWENALFPESAVELRRSLFRWARIQLIGQALIVAVALYFGLWWVPIIITLAPFYGGGLQWLCNNTQHTGHQDKVPDFRLCCRTILLNPFLRYLYWQMNYHTEHHMYAAVPCYNLGKLHGQIQSDLPRCPSGLAASWREIIAILRRQKVDPGISTLPICLSTPRPGTSVRGANRMCAPRLAGFIPQVSLTYPTGFPYGRMGQALHRPGAPARAAL